MILTNEKCIGCNRCISGCPVACTNQSIVDNGKQVVNVNQDRCIGCGACMDSCLHNARDYEDDTEVFFTALAKGEKISILLAPSFLANYPKEYTEVLGGLKKLGVNKVISVSFGADITTWGYINYITKHNFIGGVSQPCPAIVRYIEKYIPNLISSLVPIHSPMMCAAVYAKKYMGLSDKLAFISPCIAKKYEIDDPNNKGYISYNVTFSKLMEYVKKHRISGEKDFDEIEYGLGAIYPMPGGLKENVHWFCGDEMFIRQVEGKLHVYEFLENYNERKKQNKELPFMVDALNCESGCIYGTAVEEAKKSSEDTFYEIQRIKERNKKKGMSNPFSKRLSPKKRLARLNKQFKNLDINDFIRKYTDKSATVKIAIPSEEEIQHILIEMNKDTKEKQSINCCACGYNNCRDMANAIYSGCNKKENCVHYVKELVETEMQEAKSLKAEVEEKNRQIAGLAENVAQDFTALNASIREMSEGNAVNAEKTSGISSDMADVTQFCNELNHILGQINEILPEFQKNNSEISNISRETTLLSFNARIESGRAGEAGRGFSVIAEHIKTLSESSVRSSADNDKIHLDINNATNELLVKADSLFDTIDAINDDLTVLAASSEEIAATAVEIKSISGDLREKIDGLK